MESAHSLLQMPDWAVKSCPQFMGIKCTDKCKLDQLRSDIHLVRVVKCFQTHFLSLNTCKLLSELEESGSKIYFHFHYRQISQFGVFMHFLKKLNMLQHVLE